MSDPISDWFATNWLLLLFIIGGIAAAVYFFYKPVKEPEYKKLNIEKEIKKHIKNVFDLTEENIGYGKTLYVGSRDAGFIIKSIHINQYQTLTETAQIADFLKKHPETAEIVEKSNEKVKALYKLMGFQVCGRGRIKRVLAQLGIGISYFLIEDILIKETETSFNINAYSQPVKSCGVWIFSSVGRSMIDEIAYKITDEQRLEALINTIPRSLFLSDLDHAKEKSSIDLLEDIKHARRAEELDRIKRE